VRSAELVNEQLAVQVVIKEKFVLALWKAHSKASNSTVALKTFDREGFVLYPQDGAPGLYSDAIAMCQHAGFYPRHSQQASQIPTILAFVAAGLGVALLPASVQSIRWPGVVFRPLSDIESNSVLALAWRKGKASPVVEKFINVVSSEMNRLAKTK
jgi:DNA-binding transcriptional LysR family regulator